MRQYNAQKPRQRVVAGWLLGGLTIALLLVGVDLFASEGGDPFMRIWQTIAPWFQSALGRAICAVMVLIGAIVGATKQCLRTFFFWVGGALVLYNLPTIVVWLQKMAVR